MTKQEKMQLGQGTIDIGRIFSALVDNANHAESISWDRFYSFLTGNSILVLAWATIFVSKKMEISQIIVLLCICIIGYIGGICWHKLEKRSREYLNTYNAFGLLLEKDISVCRKLKFYMPFTLTDDIEKTLVGVRPGSYKILTIGPLLFSGLYVVLFLISIIKAL